MFDTRKKNKDERKVAMMKKNIPSSKVRKDCVNEYFVSHSHLGKKIFIDFSLNTLISMCIYIYIYILRSEGNVE